MNDTIADMMNDKTNRMATADQRAGSLASIGPRHAEIDGFEQCILQF
jgi:hypothetical protein